MTKLTISRTVAVVRNGWKFIGIGIFFTAGVAMLNGLLVWMSIADGKLDMKSLGFDFGPGHYSLPVAFIVLGMFMVAHESIVLVIAEWRKK